MQDGKLLLVQIHFPSRARACDIDDKRNETESNSKRIKIRQYKKRSQVDFVKFPQTKIEKRWRL